jgi:hypothetical protein
LPPRPTRNPREYEHDKEREQTEPPPCLGANNHEIFVYHLSVRGHCSSRSANSVMSCKRTLETNIGTCRCKRCHWEWDPETDAVVWSDQTYRIFALNAAVSSFLCLSSGQLTNPAHDYIDSVPRFGRRGFP